METTMSARWGMPVFGLLMGVLLFAASAIGGQPVLGLGMFAVMAVYSAILLVFGGRSETIGVLGGRPADERLASFNILATAVARHGRDRGRDRRLPVVDRPRRERERLRRRRGRRRDRLPRRDPLVPLAGLTEGRGCRRAIRAPELTARRQPGAPTDPFPFVPHSRPGSVGPSEGGTSPCRSPQRCTPDDDGHRHRRRRRRDERRARARHPRLHRPRLRAPVAARREGAQRHRRRDRHRRAQGPARRARVPLLPAVLPPRHRHDGADPGRLGNGRRQPRPGQPRRDRDQRPDLDRDVGLVPAVHRRHPGDARRTRLGREARPHGRGRERLRRPRLAAR